MKKPLIVLTALLFLAGAGCNGGNNQITQVPVQQQTNSNVTAQPTADNTQQNTVAEKQNQIQSQTSVSDRYIVTEKNVYTAGHPKAVSFSLYGTDGTLNKTLTSPSDLIQGIAGNLQTHGSNIFYLSGSAKDTSIKEMSTVDGSITPLDFTRSSNTNVGNELSGIRTWTVSDDSQHIAWIDTTGKISKANIDGSGLQTVETKENNPNLAVLQFSPDASDLYFWTQGNGDLVKWHLADNTQTTIVVKLSLNPDFTLSPSGRYLVSFSSKGDAVIKNLATNTQVTVPLEKNYDLFESVTFSPDEQQIVLDEIAIGGGSSPAKTMTVNVDSGKTSVVGNDISAADFILNFLVVLRKETNGSTFVAGPNGQNLKKISDDWYVGFVTSK